jgi:flagellar capping protein FliD
LQGQVSTLQGQVTTLQGQVATLQSSNTTLTSQVSTLQTALSTANSDIAALQTAVTAVQSNPALALGPYVSVDSGVENGLKGPHVIFSGVNVHILSGSGATVDKTGLGNLVVGYDEDSLDSSTIDGNRSGSHDLVVGPQHEFTASGSVVFATRTSPAATTPA